VKRKKGIGNVVAEIPKAQILGVPRRAYELNLNSGKEILTAMYLRRVRVAGRAAAGSITRIDRLYLASILVGRCPRTQFYGSN
jgi:hypothetical protein